MWGVDQIISFKDLIKERIEQAKAKVRDGVIDSAKQQAKDNIWSRVTQDAHKLSFTIDLDTDAIEVSSDDKNVDGEPSLQFTISNDGTIVEKNPVSTQQED